MRRQVAIGTAVRVVRPSLTGWTVILKVDFLIRDQRNLAHFCEIWSLAKNKTIVNNFELVGLTSYLDIDFILNSSLVENRTLYSIFSNLVILLKLC